MLATETRGDTTKANLRAAAAECFSEFGFRAATMTEIARRAETSEATVYVHYPTKFALLTAVTEDFYDELQRAAELTLEQAELDPEGQLRALVNSWSDHLAEGYDLIRAFVQAAADQPGTELASTVHRLNRRYTRLFTGVIDRLKLDARLSVDLSTSLARDMLFGALEHTARGQQNAGRPVDTRRAGQRAIDVLLTSNAPAPADDRLATIEEKLDHLIDVVHQRQQARA